MVSIYYLIGFFIVIQKIYHSITIKKHLKEKFDLDKQIRTKNIEFFESWDDVDKKLILFTIPEVVWLAIGLLSFNWFIFVFIFVEKSIFSLFNSLFVKPNSLYKISILLSLIIEILVIGLMVINHFHLNLDLYEFLKSL